jgi:hypothetical protein
MKSALTTSGADGAITYTVDNGLCHGGLLAYQVSTIYIGPTKKNSIHTSQSNSTKWIPYGNGKNGTFIDLSKHKDYKIPPMNISPPKINGPINGPRDENCHRSSIPNPMIACTMLPGTIIAGTTVAEKNKPDGILLKSMTGSVTKFDDYTKYGALCTFVDSASGGGNCWGERDGNKGPYAITLHTNGALCLYNNIGAYACTAGGPKNDGMYRLSMQTDGNLVIYRGPGINKPLWSSDTAWSKGLGPVTCGKAMTD